MSEMAQNPTTITVYSDLNCPYCFTLNEWLHRSGVADRVHWLGIEHEAGLSTQDLKSESAMEALRAEVADVRERDSQLTIRVPSWRYPSGPALAALHRATELDPAKAAAFRREIFRALWIDDRDIADLVVLGALSESCGLPSGLLNPNSVSAVAAVTAEWEFVPVDRIPSISAPTGTWHVGLGTEKQVSVFLGSALFDAKFDGSCSI